MCLAAGADPSASRTATRSRSAVTSRTRRPSACAIHGRRRRGARQGARRRSRWRTVCCRVMHECGGADWPLSRKFGCEARDVERSARRRREARVAPCGVSFHVGSQQRNLDAWDTTLEVVAGSSHAPATAVPARRSSTSVAASPARTTRSTRDRGLRRARSARPLRGAFPDGLAGDRRAGALPRRRRRCAADRGRARVAPLVRRRRALGVPRLRQVPRPHRDDGRVDQVPHPHAARRRPDRPGWLAGPTCDTADILYEKTDYELPLALEDGDLVDVMSTGAYTTTYSSVSNPHPFRDKYLKIARLPVTPRPRDIQR